MRKRQIAIPASRGRIRAPVLKRAVVSQPIPAPIGGWNARDALDMMGPADAITLDNWYPAESYIELRGGSASHATGLTDEVETLMSYSAGATGKMFAATDGGNVYDATSSGAVSSAEVSSLSNGRLNWVNFGTDGGSFLWFANGSDSPRYYNGASWSTPTLTGVSASDIVSPRVFKRRLFFRFNNSLKFGYLPVASIMGEVSTFDLRPIFEDGGKLQSIGTWTRDGGRGPDDLIAFVTNHGEVAIYAGDDPSVAANWTLQGVFKIGSPIGDRSTIKVGADLFIITVDGYVPLSKVLPQDRSAPGAAISDKIRGAVIDRAQSYKNTFGWQPVLYSAGGYGLFNVPRGNSKYEQHVVNVNTGSWCRFTGWNGHCFNVFNDELYFGGSGIVYKGDTGTTDAGSAIEANGQTAFSNFGFPGMPKGFVAIRPVVDANGGLPTFLAVHTDFRQNGELFSTTQGGSSGPAWDTSPWDTTAWASDEGTYSLWYGCDGSGYTGSLQVKAVSSDKWIKWYSSDLMFEVGHGL